MRETIQLDKNGKIKITERMVKQQIREYLKQLPNCYYWHNLQGLGCKLGLPDYEGVYMGYHFYIEAKSPRGSQRPAQVEFERMVKIHGETYILADNLEAVEKGLSEIRNKAR